MHDVRRPPRRKAHPTFSVPQEALAYFASPEAWVGVSSSNVGSIGYFEGDEYGVKNTLGVRFLSGDVYYYDVPHPSIAAALISAPSVGEYLDAAIKKTGVPYSGPH